MMFHKTLSVSMTRAEKTGAWFYFAFEFLALPTVLALAGMLLPRRLTPAETNFLFFTVNFLALSLILHKFLAKSFRKVSAAPVPFLRGTVLGLAGYYALGYLAGDIAWLFNPDFSNANDSAVAAMTNAMRIPMLVATTVFVPVAEECLFRGLIFRGLYNRSRTAAFCISTLAFAAVHIMGFLGTYSPWDVLCALVQYLPAGICLGWAYAVSDTIAAPIIMHAVINAAALFSVR